MNITIKFNWFYCAIIQKTFSTIFSEWCGKTKLAAKLLITLKQEQEMKKFNCKHKLQCCKLLQPTKHRECIAIESRASNRLK